MNIWLIAAGVLMVGGLGPALILAGRGPAAHRMIGLQLAGSVSVILLVLLCQGFNQSSYLIVPVVLALLAVAGTLVFTRLLGTGDE
jgi:multisubunit Na+/H+ antiporter MnhF subunit